MSEPLSPLGLLSEERGGVNLTYFVFAAPTVSVPDLPAVLPNLLPDALSGRYHLEWMLGTGGAGTVYRAWNLFYEQFDDPAPLVALKLLNGSIVELPDASALSYSEFALTRRLRHPNVVHLFTLDVDTVCRRAYIVMEPMPGPPLDRLLYERPGGLPWSELSAIARPLLDAPAYVYEQGALHGDLKSSNAMLGEEGMRLFDFGPGQVQIGILDGLPQLSQGRIDARTPGYVAPEPSGGAPLSSVVNLYALVCVLYGLADGRHPSCRLPSNQTREQGLEHQLHVSGYLSQRCWLALRTALSLDPERRYIGVRELQEALGAWCSRLAGVPAR